MQTDERTYRPIGDGHTDKKTDREADIKIYRQSGRCTDGHKDRQRGRHTERQANRQ